MKRQVNVLLDSALIDGFNLYYRGCISKFIRNAMKLAVNDRSFFDKVFFALTEVK